MRRLPLAAGACIAGSLFITIGLIAASSSAAAQLVFDLAAPEAKGRIESEHVTLSPADGDGFVPVHFQAADEPILRINAGAEGWNWSAAREVRMHLQNAMAWPVTVQILLTDAVGGRLNTVLGLPPGGPLTLSIPLRAADPKRWGMRAGPPIPWLHDGAPVAVALTTTGELDSSRIAGIRIAIPRPAAEQTLRIGKVFVEPRSDRGAVEDAAIPDRERLAYTGIVDHYGQYTRGEWPEKYKAEAPGKAEARDKAEARGTGKQSIDASFAAFAQSFETQASRSDRSELNAAESRDPYGGLRGLHTKPAAPSRDGFFRTAKLPTDDGRSRWVLLTPDGNPFFSLGVNAVQLSNSQTFVEGREFMFTGLPDDGEPLARFHGAQDSADALPRDAGAQRGRGYGKGRTFDFYRANLFRRDGDDFEERWLARTRERLRRWDFNTIGSWSDDPVGSGARIPYTRIIHVAGDFAKLSDGNDWWAGIADTFDPRFSEAVERAITAQIEPFKGDPWLIGYFVDNELGWGNGAATDPRARYALAWSALSGDARQPQAHAKRALIELLKSRHGGSIEKLSDAWQRRFDSWEALQGPLPAQGRPDATNPAVAADLSAFLSLHAERYFEQVARTLKRHDPDHLYLGARFASRTSEALRACAKWCDVVSFNLYLPSLDVGFEAPQFHRLDKPALLTEFHFGSNDRGPFWNGVMSVAREADRAPAYARMLESVLANPDFVGAHWFQYLDQAVTGRWLDGENGHLGLVAITDIPWSSFVSEIAKTNHRIQQQLFGRLRNR